MDSFGSSPHTRGARHQSGYHGCRPGIIPAYAGSTIASRNWKVIPADHPRIRGEHFETAPFITSWIGSSPHTRGALWPGALRRRWRGIIPAYAGSTGGAHTPSPTGRGSSPHTRGALHAERCSSRKTGIIPAYAGSTGSFVAARPWARDHPRIRGEHNGRFPAVWISDGSSPHTRGARVGDQLPQLLPGIIPAYAGSTYHICRTGRER